MILQTNIKLYYNAMLGDDNWTIIDKITVDPIFGSITREKYVFFVRDITSLQDFRESIVSPNSDIF